MARFWLLALFLVAPVVNGQTLQTWSFDTEADIPSDPDWIWMEDGDAIVIDSTVFNEGTGSLRFDCAEGYCGWWWEVDVTEDLIGQAVTLSVDIKTDYTDSDNPAYIWLRFNSKLGERLTRGGLWDDAPMGKQDWDRYSYTMPVPEGAANIGIMLESGGVGTAWFDNMTLEATEWNRSKAIAQWFSDRLALWTGAWFGWLKVLMVYAFFPLLLLFFASRSKTKEPIHSVPWALRFFGMACFIMVVALSGQGYNLTQLPLYHVFNAGPRVDQVIYTILFAALFTGIWYRYRDRIDEVQLWRNQTVVIRFFLCGVFLIYAIAKIYRTQFMGLTPAMLDGRFGDRNSMRLLWQFFGHSYPYVLFAAAGQIVGCVLLLSRRTYQIGAIVLIMVVSNIVFVNFAYNIPVKYQSVILLIMLIFLTLEEVPRWLHTLLHRATELAPAVPYRPGLSWKFRAPLTIAIGVFFVWNAHEELYGYVKQTAEEASWMPQIGVWTMNDREVNFPADSSGQTIKWNRLVFDQPNGIQIKFDDEVFSTSKTSHFDSLGVFVLQFKDSTDQYIGRYAFDADTLRLNGTQFGDSLSLDLVKRSFILEPEFKYPMWRPSSDE